MMISVLRRIIVFSIFFLCRCVKKHNTCFFPMMMYSVAIEMLERCYDLKVKRMCKKMQNKKFACSVRPNYGRKYPE